MSRRSSPPRHGGPSVQHRRSILSPPKNSVAAGSAPLCHVIFAILRATYRLGHYNGKSGSYPFLTRNFCRCGRLCSILAVHPLGPFVADFDELEAHPVTCLHERNHLPSCVQYSLTLCSRMGQFSRNSSYTISPESIPEAGPSLPLSPSPLGRRRLQQYIVVFTTC